MKSLSVGFEADAGTFCLSRGDNAAVERHVPRKTSSAYIAQTKAKYTENFKKVQNFAIYIRLTRNFKKL